MEIEELSKKEIKIIKELWRGEKEKVNELSRNIETTYSHVHKRLKKLEKKDLVKSKKHGRSKKEKNRKKMYRNC